MNIALIIKALLKEGLCETDIKNLLEKRGITTSQPTLNRIKNNKAGKIDHNLVNALIELHNLYVGNGGGIK